MSSDLFKKIELEESERTKEVATTFLKNHQLNILDIIGNEITVKELVNGTRVWTS